MAPSAAAAEAEAQKVVADLLTRLLSETCLVQTKAALKEDGIKTILAAGQVLGKFAMQELMASAAVRASILRIEEEVDYSKLGKILRE